MCPASASTATPSGFRQPVTSVFAPDPSRVIQNTWPPLKLRTHNRSVATSVAPPRFSVEALLLAVISVLPPSFRVVATRRVQQHARHESGAVGRAQSGANGQARRVRPALLAGLLSSGIQQLRRGT